MDFLINIEIIDRRVENMMYCTWEMRFLRLDMNNGPFQRRSCK